MTRRNPHLQRMIGIGRIGGNGWKPAAADYDAVRRHPPVPCGVCDDGTEAHYSPTVGRYVCDCGAIRISATWRVPR